MCRRIGLVGRAAAPVRVGEQTRGFVVRVTRAVGSGCMWRSWLGPEDRDPRVGACSGPDEVRPGVRVLSWMSAGAGQLSEAGPVRVVKVEQQGGLEHRGR